MSWSRDRQKIRTTYNYATKRLVQLELGGDKRLRFSVETYEDEAAAIKDRTWKDDWQKRSRLRNQRRGGATAGRRNLNLKPP